LVKTYRQLYLLPFNGKIFQNRERLDLSGPIASVKRPDRSNWITAGAESKLKFQPVKHLIIIISVLLAHSFPAAAHYPFNPGRVAVDTVVTPVGDPEFIEGIFAGGSG
jgi:hypothetical protein